jgi:acetylornithine deacetylase/succinyl-diaminopimelate desuccinylase-like protein
VRGLAPKWSDGLDPWQVTVRGDKWYGRGTVDNKGQHLIAIEALRAINDEIRVGIAMLGNEIASSRVLQRHGVQQRVVFPMIK